MPKEVEEEVILPPKYKRPPDRPKKARYKKSNENIKKERHKKSNGTISSNTNCCEKCRHQGHNKRICNFFQRRNDVVVPHLLEMYDQLIFS